MLLHELLIFYASKKNALCDWALIVSSSIQEDFRGVCCQSSVQWGFYWTDVIIFRDRLKGLIHWFWDNDKKGRGETDIRKHAQFWVEQSVSKEITVSKSIGVELRRKGGTMRRPKCGVTWGSLWWVVKKRKKSLQDLRWYQHLWRIDGVRVRECR